MANSEPRGRIESASDFVQRRLLWILLLSAGCALYFPTGDDVWNPLIASKAGLGTLFAGTMFFIGCLLSKSEVDELVKRWPVVLGGTLIQYASMPFLAYGIGLAFGLEGPYLTGLIFVGCVPGAMASNVITLAAKGNVSYSVSLTTSATLLSPFVVPFVLSMLLGSDNSPDPVAIMIKLLWQVVGPVVAGHLLCRFSETFAQKIRPISPLLANGTIIWIIAAVVALNQSRLLKVDGSSTAIVLVIALVLLNLCGYAAGFWGGKTMRLPDDMRRALSLEVGMQNAGLGTTLVIEFFPDQPDAAIPTAVYTFCCVLTGITLAKFWSRNGEDTKTNRS